MERIKYAIIIKVKVDDYPEELHSRTASISDCGVDENTEICFSGAYYVDKETGELLFKDDQNTFGCSFYWKYAKAGYDVKIVSYTQGEDFTSFKDNAELKFMDFTIECQQEINELLCDKYNWIDDEIAALKTECPEANDLELLFRIIANDVRRIANKD